MGKAGSEGKRGLWFGKVCKDHSAGKKEKLDNLTARTGGCGQGTDRLLEALDLVVEHFQVIARAHMWLTHLCEFCPFSQHHLQVQS